MMNKAAKKDTRNSKTPPEKKRVKTFEQPSSPVQEEPEPVSCVLQGDEIQALAIKLEDLKKLHTERPPEEEKPTTTKTFIVRKSKPQITGKKTHLLIAYPTVTDETKKTLRYSGVEGPVVDNYGQIMPHSILGTLQEYKKEALARGHTEVAAMIPDSPQSTFTVPVWWRQQREKQKEKVKVTPAPSSQDAALQNWHRNMALRKQQQKRLCEKLQKSESGLLMHFSENYREIQEERTLIERCLPALYGTGCHSGNEFWTQPEHIGDELTGLMITLGKSERGLAGPITHVGKPRSIWTEIGSKHPEFPPFHHTWDQSLFLKQRRNELKELLEKLDFYRPDLDGLEVVSRNQPFVNVSVQSFTPSDDLKESGDHTGIQDPLEEYPDVFQEPVLGPSLRFCGQPARWISSSSYKGEIGIAARISFEILVGEKAESFLIVTNDGTAAIWYDWRRQAQPSTFKARAGKRISQCFYFNTRSGVILPGETRKFSFIFKSLHPGIFSESWGFGTHPELLGGAVLQVTLWGIAVYEDRTVGLREKLQDELNVRETAVIVEENLKDLLDRIRSPAPPPSPRDAYVAEEELFLKMNPELHYQHQVVKRLHKLWDKLFNPPRVTSEGGSQRKSVASVYEHSPQKTPVESQLKIPVEDRRKSVASVISAARKSVMEEQMSHVSITEEEEDVNRVEWNLSIAGFRQSLLNFPVEEEREDALAQLNKAALELCNEQILPPTDLMYQICFQLWREVIDGLVSNSLMLRSLLGMPEKDTYAELVPEEPAEIKPAGKGGKEDRKLLKEDKKSAAKEEKKGGKTAKEERPNSKKQKSKDERKLKTSTKDTKEQTVSSADAIETEPLSSRQEQVDPVVQEKYHEKLYVEVYGLLDAMFSKMLLLFDGLKKDSLGKRNKALCGSDFIMK